MNDVINELGYLTHVVKVAYISFVNKQTKKWQPETTGKNLNFISDYNLNMKQTNIWHGLEEFTCGGKLQILRNNLFLLL